MGESPVESFVQFWFLLFVLRVIFKETLYSGLTKWQADKPGRADRIVWQQAMQFIIALLLFVTLGGAALPAFGTAAVVAFMLGTLDGPATFARWAGYSIAMTPFAFLSRTGDFLTFVLAFVLLDEGKSMTAGSAVGFGLCITAGVIYTWRVQKISRREGEGAKGGFWRYYSWTLVTGTAAALVWVFMRKYSVKASITREQFFLLYYAGGFLSTFVLRSIPAKVIQSKRTELGWRERLELLPLAAVNFTGVYLLYWVYHYKEVIVVNPMLMVCRILCPALVAMFFFGERKELMRMGWWGLVFLLIGLAGIVVLVLA